MTVPRLALFAASVDEVSRFSQSIHRSVHRKMQLLATLRTG